MCGRLSPPLSGWGGGLSRSSYLQGLRFGGFPGCILRVVDQYKYYMAYMVYGVCDYDEYYNDKSTMHTH